MRAAVGRLLATAAPIIDLGRSAPLAPAAFALTAGIFLDRLFKPSPWAVATALGAVAAMALANAPGRRAWVLAIVLLAGAARNASVGGWVGQDDISSLAGPDYGPLRIRGVIIEGPEGQPLPAPDPLRIIPVFARYEAVVAAEEVWRSGGFVPVTGEIRVTGMGKPPAAAPGDRVEAAGQIRLPPAPMNPGETDSREHGWARGILAEMRIADRPGDLEVLGPSGTWDVRVALARLRRWAAARLTGALDREVEPLAAALLLGETSRLSRESWDQYKRTGVVHVLAISGQHLVLLAMFLAVAGRMGGMRARALATPIALSVIVYAGMTGARAAAVRAAATVGAMALADILGRPRHLPSVLAASWVVVGVLDPGDLFGTGCLLSFLATALLYWATTGWTDPPTEQEEALARARDLGRSPPWRWCRAAAFALGAAMVANAIIWCGLTPLVAARTHLVSPVALVVGPPVALLGSLALLPGFPLLVAGNQVPVLSPVLAWCVSMALQGCAGLVAWASVWPGAGIWVGDISPWWLAVWYLLLVPLVAATGLAARARASMPALAWLALGLAASLAPMVRLDAWRCAFLAVGHGGCVVIEWGDGATTVYDAGSLANTGVGRRVIAPYLWRRGVGRVDDLVLSHADLDHFNGVIDLVDRIPVGRVLVSGWFARKDLPGVRFVLDELAARGIPVEEVEPGTALAHGDASLEFLHPARDFQAASQNEASLAAILRHTSGRVLLTGDLEGAGQRALMRALENPGVDVLQAPHHGSPGANTPAFMAWARPWLSIVQEDARRARDPIRPGVWSTWKEGAVIVRPVGKSLVAEGYVTGRKVDKK